MPSPVLSTSPLGFPWRTDDPFLFCVHHDDAYPAGNELLGPAVSLAGRSIGADFSGKDGFSMYHGRVVPGFPQHPHRGFETVTIARRGFIDHADSLGACARFGRGDTQWMTAGRGIVHSEMFPLIDRLHPNPVELFQIWLNLPREGKMVEPHFKMLWAEQIPTLEARDGAGRRTRIDIIAGMLGGARPPAPPPHSWASRPDSDVAIWTIRIDAGAEWIVPPANGASNRSLYFFRGTGLRVGGTAIGPSSKVRVRADVAVPLQSIDGECEVLLLQGRPVGEPVVQHGPFVMNSAREIAQTFEEYQRTGFGGWPWRSDDPVHGREAGRFATHADGRREVPGAETLPDLTSASTAP